MRINLLLGFASVCHAPRLSARVRGPNYGGYVLHKIPVFLQHSVPFCYISRSRCPLVLRLKSRSPFPKGVKNLLEFVVYVETNHLHIHTMDPKCVFPVGPFFAVWFVKVKCLTKVHVTNYQSKVLDIARSKAKKDNSVDFVGTKSVFQSVWMPTW